MPVFRRIWTAKFFWENLKAPLGTLLNWKYYGRDTSGSGVCPGSDTGSGAGRGSGSDWGSDSGSGGRGSDMCGAGFCKMCLPGCCVSLSVFLRGTLCESSLFSCGSLPSGRVGGSILLPSGFCGAVGFLAGTSAVGG